MRRALFSPVLLNKNVPFLMDDMTNVTSKEQMITSYMTELWKLFEFSNQKTAVFMNTQSNLCNLQLFPNVKKKTAKKI